MTGAETVALIEGGFALAKKILELIEATQKGDVTAAEELKARVEHSEHMKAIADEARQYLDEQFPKGEP